MDNRNCWFDTLPRDLKEIVYRYIRLWCIQHSIFTLQCNPDAEWHNLQEVANYFSERKMIPPRYLTKNNGLHQFTQ
jgi:hypothetical protein